MTASTKPLIIPDASVLIKWLLKEDGDEMQTQALQEDFKQKRVRFLIPALCSWEINNTLGRKVQPHRALEKFSYFKLLKIREVLLSTPISALAFDIMAKTPRASFYDASYHALAMHFGGTFLTCDKKYYAATKKRGHVELLSRYAKAR